jgi:hypothetical protein
MGRDSILALNQYRCYWSGSDKRLYLWYGVRRLQNGRSALCETKLYGFLHDTYLSVVRRVRYTKAATYKGKGERIYLLCNHENKSVPL